MPEFVSIPGVCACREVRGPRATTSRSPDLLVEIPHGATRTAQFRALEARLKGSYAANLVDFFHVNTDVGAPELADALADALLRDAPERVVWILQSEIPRTFIDCNRVIDASPEAFREGKVTPGVPPWIRDPDDLALLRGLHAAYTRVAESAFAAVCGQSGVAVLLHSYAPRSVDVEVDDAIVVNLHRAYQPDVEPTWPLRPAIDVIGRALDGGLLVDAELLSDLVEGYRGLGHEVADGKTYPLHPSTWGFHHAARWPGRSLCMEVRRDLLAHPFTPFAEMFVPRDVAERMAAPLARAVGRWLARLPSGGAGLG